MYSVFYQPDRECGWLASLLHAPLRNWRRWMPLRTPDSAWSAELPACIQATKQCQSRICPSAHLRYGGGAKRAATDLSNLARAEETHCVWLFPEFQMSVAIAQAVDAFLQKVPGKGGEREIIFWQVEYCGDKSL